MQSLRDLALLKSTQRIRTLEEIFRFCESRDDLKINCEFSEFFWKKTIIRIFGNIMVFQRGDLSESENWYDFASLLRQGITYKYALRENIDNGTYALAPIPFYSNYSDKPDDDEYLIKFDIPASVPNAGVSGFLAHLVIDGDKYEEITNFFVDGDQNIARNLAVKFLAVKYHDIHDRLRNNNIIKITEVYDEIKIMDYAKMPDLEYFIDSIDVNTNGSFFAMFKSGTMMQTINRIQNNPIEFFTESNYYIIPIQF